ncbi:helix-turn-helix domain-containing protein [Streptomyces sp. NPDC018031]|uniref:helix-turn-helix domain-containing protein n=1 Tax=Streptomyces sp. NPDC018031 TaxID=3365033 RepID=UPI0037879A65
MSTDFQKARAELGIRLRELREASPEGRLTGSALAERLGWPQSKVSKLENGRQTATAEDLRLWAEAVGCPGAARELLSRLNGLESHIRSWRRQLASGHRPVQETWNALMTDATVVRSWVNAVIPGMVQTADYARHVFLAQAELRSSPRDTEDAVRARMKRQEQLYVPGKKFHLLVWEAALHARICPPAVLRAQLDRLSGVIGMDTVSLGVVPLSASLSIPPANGFTVLDNRLAITEDWHAELWLDDADTVATYLRIWETLERSAVFGPEAQRVIHRVRQSL